MGPETDSGGPKVGPKSEAEPKANPVTQANEIAGQTAVKAELGKIPGKEFVTNVAELQRELAEPKANVASELPVSTIESAAEQQAKIERTAAINKASTKEVAKQASNLSEVIAKLKTLLITASEQKKSEIQADIDDAEEQKSDWEIALYDRLKNEQSAPTVPVAEVASTPPIMPAEADKAQREVLANVARSQEFFNKQKESKDLNKEILTAPESTNTQTPQEEFNSLQQNLIGTLDEKGISVAMYRTGNEISADYTDKNGKPIGLETIRRLFGKDMPKVAELVGNMERLAYTNRELFATRETTSERTARLASDALDRQGAQLVAKAPELKSKGLWAQAMQWLTRGKEKTTGIISSFQTRVSEIQQQRSERRVTTNFQRFAKNFNLMTPDMIRTDQTMIGLTREIDTKSQECIRAADITSGLKESIRRLKVMEARLGRMKEVRELEKRRDTYQEQMNMLKGQLNKLRDSYIAVDKKLVQDQTLEKQSLEDQLRAKNPERPAYYSQEQEIDDTPKKQPYYSQEKEMDDVIAAAKTPAAEKQPYYSQEQEMTDTAARERSETDFDKAQTDEAAPTVDTSVPTRTIPLGPPATPTPPTTPETQTGEAA
jgi:hypothetical protein